jgi:predicted DNA-binding protein YlxM (UPF0122 family)
MRELAHELEVSQDEVRESKKEHEAAVAQFEADIERVREMSKEREAKTKEKTKSFLEVNPRSLLTL